MKSIKTLAAIACAATILASCSDDQTAFDVNSVPGRVTIQGTVVYNQGTSLDEGKFVYDYKPAANLEVFVIAQNYIYDDNLEGESVFTATTDENGKYSIEIPAPLQNASVTLRTADFAGTHTTVQRVNNEIVTTSQNVVYGASTSISVRSHSVAYGDMTCVERDAEFIPSNYAQYATLNGSIGRNAELKTAITPRYNDDNEIVGYDDAQLHRFYEPVAGADIIVSVEYAGQEFAYNATTDKDGYYELSIPVAEFPASFTYEIEVMPMTGTFSHYTETSVEKVLANGNTVTCRDYEAHKIDGWYGQNTSAPYTSGTLSYPVASDERTLHLKALLFNPYAGEDAYGYSTTDFPATLPWKGDILN